jgi:hypothetical protein
MRARVVLVLVLATVLAACGSSGSSKAKSATTSPPTNKTSGTVSTLLGQGVTPTEIKVGVMMIDFTCIEGAVDSIEPDQQQAFQAFFDAINVQGINGRKIVPVYKSYCPTDRSQEEAACTALTEDDHVFATIGTFYNLEGDAQLCFAKDHKTVIVANQITRALVAKAPPGYMVSPDIAPERRLEVIMQLLKSQNTLQGKTVGTISNAPNKSRVTTVVDPALKEMGVKQGAAATLSISSSDTTAALSELDSFIERWKSDGTNALIFVGEDVVDKQFVQKIKAAIPDTLIVADTTAPLSNGQDLQKAHTVPNPYDGAMSAEGQTGTEHTQTPHFAYCRDIYQKATGRTVPAPTQVVKLPNGKQDDIYAEEEDACRFTHFFQEIAQRVGPYLNNANWVQTVDNYGPIDDVGTLYASIHAGKYDADDTYGLVAFDPTIGDAGDWRHVTPVQNVSGTG